MGELGSVVVVELQIVCKKKLAIPGERYYFSSQSVRDLYTPKGIRTPVASVKGRCPRPLDDGGEAAFGRCVPDHTKKLRVRRTLRQDTGWIVVQVVGILSLPYGNGEEKAGSFTWC